MDDTTETFFRPTQGFNLKAGMVEDTGDGFLLKINRVKIDGNYTTIYYEGNFEKVIRTVNSVNIIDE